MTLFSIQAPHKRISGRKATILLFIITLLPFSIFVSNVKGAQIRLAWDAVDDSNSVGYRLHYGASSGRYSNSIDAGQNTTCTVANLTGGATYFFAVTAYTQDGNDSGYSDEVSYTVPGEVTLSSVTIGGPPQIDENTSSHFVCTAHYSDGTSAVLTSGVTWSVDAAAAVVDSSGILSAGNVDADTTVTITAAYGSESVTQSVSIKDISPTLSSITISGPIQVEENSSAQLACTAHYSDGNSAVLTSGVSWSEDSAAATISSSGNLSTGAATLDTSVSVTATYNGVTDTHSVTIKKSAVVLSSLSISGPARLDEKSSGQYSCAARYSDNSTSTVTDSVQWSVNSEFAVIDATGLLTTQAIQSDKHLTITAAYDNKQTSFDLIIDNSKSNYFLNIDITGSGTVLLDPPGGIYDKGTVVTLAAEAEPAWTFDGWIGAVADAESKTTSVIMDADIDLSATFLEDTDLDSVPDQEEWGSDSKDTGYDGNADGIADYLQGSVASLHTKDYQSYISLSTMEAGRITICQTLEAEYVAEGPADHTLPLGLFAFRIEDIPPGEDTVVTIRLPMGSEFETYYKYGPTLDDPSDHWYEFMYDQSSKTGAVIDGDTITLYFKDGLRGDSDLSANGVISDPGGPANFGTDPAPPGQQLSDNNPASKVPAGGSSGCFIDSIFISPH